MRDQTPLGGQRVDFRAFFEAESAKLVQMCWAVTLDRELARDVAQETMTRAWRQWDRLAAPATPGDEPLPSPAAWCRTVALNLIRSQWRRDNVARSASLVAPEPVELDASDLDLRAALAELPVRQREAVVLFHLVDLPVTECARVMDLSEPTVKTHLQRGRDRLRQLLVDRELQINEH